MLRYEDVAELVRIIDGSSCAEFVLDTPELKLTLRRHGIVGPIAPVPTPNAPHAAPPTAPMVAPTQTAAAPRFTGHQQVEAPMIGTFYGAPAPGQPPFVQLGSQVAAGDKLCLIEVMKLYTTIFAPTSGIIREICAHDGELVEYGQTLFVIEPV